MAWRLAAASSLAPDAAGKCDVEVEALIVSNLNNWGIKARQYQSENAVCSAYLI
jgi:hypothetical protein